MKFFGIELPVEDVVEQSDEQAGLELKDSASIVDRPGTSQGLEEGEPDRGGDQNKEQENTECLRSFATL